MEASASDGYLGGNWPGSNTTESEHDGQISAENGADNRLMK